MDHVPLAQARAQLAELVGRVSYGGERVVLTRHGRPAAALVPIADLDRLLDAAEVPFALRGPLGFVATTEVTPLRPGDVAAQHLRRPDAHDPGSPPP